MNVRIAYLTHYAELLGANRSMLDLVLEARRRGTVDPLVVVPREGPLTARLDAEGVRWTVVPFQPWMSERRYMGGPHHRLGQWWRYRRAARARARMNREVLPQLLRVLEEQRVQAVHVNSAAVGITALLRAAWSKPLIWHIRELPERQYLLHIDQGRAAYGRALASVDRLIVISAAVEQDVLRYAPHPAPMVRILNGVIGDARYAVLRAHAHERWERQVPFVFALVGLIHASKGQEEAVQALDLVRRERPDVRLLLAGSGRTERLNALIARLGLTAHVDVLGHVDDPFAVFARAHTCLMCSRNEAMGRVTVEAMASGLPVIGHASGGTLELVQPGANGWLYDGGAPALAERMLEVVRDPALARRTGERAMALAAERFSIERMTGRVLQVYAECFPSA